MIEDDLLSKKHVFRISEVAEAQTMEDIETNWKWIEENLMPTLGEREHLPVCGDRSSTFPGSIDAGADITDFVRWKITSMCAQADEDEVEGMMETT